MMKQKGEVSAVFILGLCIYYLNHTVFPFFLPLACHNLLHYYIKGLFAACDIAPRTVLHEAPCIMVPKSQYDDHCKHTIFEEYLFNAPDGTRMLALGYGSLFNHSRKPNADYRLSPSTQTITYSTGHRPVKKGEELCIYYGSDDHLWFKLPPEEGEESVSSEDLTDESWLQNIGAADDDEDDQADE
jgi:hypothetical protein